MVLNKKGMFFTLIAIALILLFVAAYTSVSIITDRSSIDKRIDTMNNFVFSTQEDLSRQLYIFGSRAIFIFEKKISEQGNYISNLNDSFSEMFFNGMLDNQTQDTLNGATFSDINNYINERAGKINVQVLIYPKYISLGQDDPWRLKVTLGANIVFLDSNNLASWNKTEEHYAYIPLDNFEDPLYTLSTSGRIIHKINQTIYNPLVSGDNINNLSLHLQNHYYISSTLAPSFIQRLQGDLSPSPHGIESLVDLQELSNQGIFAQDKSSVDYIYFSGNNPPSKNIKGMPSWFKLDSDHLGIYNVSTLVY